jgi:hypothetical protein
MEELMKLLRRLGFLFFGAAVVGLGACATTEPVGITADPSVSLPATFDNVWYRTEKVRLFGLAYEAAGRLTVREDSLEFSHQDGVVTIATKNIQKVAWGKLSPDIMNDWVIVHIAGSNPEALAAFKPAVLSGGNDSKLYSAVVRAARKN